MRFDDTFCEEVRYGSILFRVSFQRARMRGVDEKSPLIVSEVLVH